MTRQSHTAANSSHAAAPVVRIPDERLARSLHDRTRRAIEARLASPVRPTTVERLGKTRPEHREARHIAIRPTWRDDLAELVGEIRAAPLSHAVVAVAGFMVGTFGILGLAELLAGFGL
jgi:hypothetical protein